MVSVVFNAAFCSFADLELKVFIMQRGGRLGEVRKVGTNLFVSIAQLVLQDGLAIDQTLHLVSEGAEGADERLCQILIMSFTAM